MRFSDIPRNPDLKTLFQFSVIWLIAFSLLAGMQYWRYNHTTAAGILAIVALIGGCIGMIKPSFMKPIFVGWMILAFPIGWTVSLVLLGLIFYLVIAPIGLALRLFGHDPLKLRTSKVNSYWDSRKNHQDQGRYLKQY